MARLLGIAHRTVPRAPMEQAESAEITCERGVANDLRGKPGKRQVTVLAREAWQRACAELGSELDWTLRRANLLVEGVDLQEASGAGLRIGDALLEICCETDPCALMDKFRSGLREALEPEWRGGVSCRVLEGGLVRIGDPVELITADAARAAAGG